MKIGDLGKEPPSSTYVIEAIEYVRRGPLSPNALFDDPDQLDRLLEYTRQSLDSRRPDTTGDTP